MHVAKCLIQGETSVERNVHAANCPWCEKSWHCWNRCVLTFKLGGYYKLQRKNCKQTGLFTPQNGFVIDLTPEMGRHINETPKRHILGRKDVIMTYISSKSVHRCDLCAWRRDQKRKKRKKHDSGKLGIRPNHPHRRIEIKFCMVGGLQVIVLRFEFHQNRSNGFGALGVEFALSHWFDHWFIQQLVLPYKPW